MSRNFRLWEDGQQIELLNPAADSGGRTSSYFSLANAQKAYIVCHITQGNAATILLTPLQAADSAGSTSKALTQNVPIVANIDVTASNSVVAQADAKNYTTDAGVKHKIVIFEIDPVHCMDMNNLTNGPFSYIAVSTGASNAANITSAMLILMPLRNATNAN